MKRLIDMGDKNIREEIGEYYIVTKSRILNLVDCFNGGVKRISELTDIVNAQQEEIKKLAKELLVMEGEAQG